MTKPVADALAKYAKIVAKDYNLPVAEVSRIFMKWDVTQKGDKGETALRNALDECARLRAKLTMGALKKNGLL
jgi:hypothetical protein